MKQDDLITLIATYELSIEQYPNIIYVTRKGFPYVEEFVKVADVGNDREAALVLALDKIMASIKAMGVKHAA